MKGSGLPPHRPDAYTPPLVGGVGWLGATPPVGGGGGWVIARGVSDLPRKVQEKYASVHACMNV